MQAAGLPNGTFYNNNIGDCTAKQVMESDSRDTVIGQNLSRQFIVATMCDLCAEILLVTSGTFVWSGAR